MTIRLADLKPDAVKTLQALGDTLRAQNIGLDIPDAPPSTPGTPEELVLYRSQGQDELLPLAELQARADAEGLELTQEGEHVLKSADLTQRLAVWTLKAASTDKDVTDADGFPASSYLVVGHPKKPSTWALKYKDKDGKFSPTLAGGAWAALTVGYRGQKYDGPDKDAAMTKLKAAYKAAGEQTPDEKESGKKASKGLSADDLHLTDKASLRYLVRDCVQKGMAIDAPQVAGAVEFAAEQGLIAHLPEAYGGSGLDWDSDAPLAENEANPAPSDDDPDPALGQNTVKQTELDSAAGLQPDTAPSGPADQTKQMDDDDDDEDSGADPAIVLSTAYDAPETWIRAIDSVCDSFVSALTSLDNIQDSQGKPGLGIPFASLRAQLDSALDAIYTASGEEQEGAETGDMAFKGFEPERVQRAVRKAVAQTAWIQKAGKRHNKTDVSLIQSMHDHSLVSHETARKLEPGVCIGTCPMNPANVGEGETVPDNDADDAGGTSASKGMKTDVTRTPAGDAPATPAESQAEVERLQALLREKEAEVEGLQAKGMALEQSAEQASAERDQLTRQLDGFRRARDGSAAKIAPDPLAEGKQNKGMSLRPDGASNVYELLADDEDHRIPDWRFSP